MVQPSQHLRGIFRERSLSRNLGLTQIQNHNDACADTSPGFVFSFQDVKQLSSQRTQPQVVIEAYHLEAISHHSAPNWTVCVLYFHFFPLHPLREPTGGAWEMTLSASHWASSSSKAHVGATHGRLESSLLCGLVRFTHWAAKRRVWLSFSAV